MICSCCGDVRKLSSAVLQTRNQPTDLVPPHNLVLLRVDFEEGEHVGDGGRRGGAAEHDVQEHPVDAERVVVEGDGEALAELDELADFLEGPVAVCGYYVLHGLREETNTIGIV